LWKLTSVRDPPFLSVRRSVCPIPYPLIASWASCGVPIDILLNPHSSNAFNVQAAGTVRLLVTSRLLGSVRSRLLISCDWTLPVCVPNEAVWDWLTELGRWRESCDSPDSRRLAGVGVVRSVRRLCNSGECQSVCRGFVRV
jgi:hypothetical protein